MIFTIQNVHFKNYNICNLNKDYENRFKYDSENDCDKCNNDIYDSCNNSNSNNITNDYERNVNNRNIKNEKYLIPMSGLLFKFDKKFIDLENMENIAKLNENNIDFDNNSIENGTVDNIYYGYDEEFVYIYFNTVLCKDPSYYPYFNYSKDSGELYDNLKTIINFAINNFFKKEFKFKYLL